MSDTVKTLVSEFAANRPLYEAFTKSLCGALDTLLENHQMEVLPLELRTKDLESFERKISKDNKQEKYKKLHHITDLSGVRIIAFLQQDCDTICNIIENNFEIDWENSVRKNEELDADKFGYLSTHYVISYDPPRLKVGEFQRFAGLKAEIQVRTILQHTWAAIDWKLRYRSKNEVPKELLRRLFRISALLEAADDDFSFVSHRIDELRVQYGYQIEHGNLDLPINAESYEAYITRSAEVRLLADMAHSAGLTPTFEHAAAVGATTTLFNTLHLANITTIGEIDNALRDFMPTAKTRLTHVAKEKSDSIMFSLSGIIRFALLDILPAATRKRILQQSPFISDGVNRFLVGKGANPKKNAVAVRVPKAAPSRRRRTAG